MIPRKSKVCCTTFVADADSFRTSASRDGMNCSVVCWMLETPTIERTPRCIMRYCAAGHSSLSRWLLTLDFARVFFDWFRKYADRSQDAASAWACKLVPFRRSYFAVDRETKGPSPAQG